MRETDHPRERERERLPAEWSPERVSQVGSRGPGLELEEDPFLMLTFHESHRKSNTP